jgi:hypothetical protein
MRQEAYGGILVFGMLTIALTFGMLAQAWWEPTAPPGFKAARATVFWVGEEATADNDYIANDASAWDSRWKEHYGGTDNPILRCGYIPCGFRPRENPFYIALPYNDLDDEGNQKPTAILIPWYRDVSQGETLLKNRWVEVRLRSRSCFGQWQDVGPFESDDFEYVFGEAAPKNLFGVGAGIDLSPALRDCLRMVGNEFVLWRFTEESEVPEGPWKERITSRSLSH